MSDDEIIDDVFFLEGIQPTAVISTGAIPDRYVMYALRKKDAGRLYTTQLANVNLSIVRTSEAGTMHLCTDHEDWKQNGGYMAFVLFSPTMYTGSVPSEAVVFDINSSKFLVGERCGDGVPLHTKSIAYDSVLNSVMKYIVPNAQLPYADLKNAVAQLSTIAADYSASGAENYAAFTQSLLSKFVVFQGEWEARRQERQQKLQNRESKRENRKAAAALLLQQKEAEERRVAELAAAEAAKLAVLEQAIESGNKKAIQIATEEAEAAVAASQEAADSLSRIEDALVKFVDVLTASAEATKYEKPSLDPATVPSPTSEDTSVTVGILDRVKRMAKDITEKTMLPAVQKLAETKVVEWVNRLPELVVWLWGNHIKPALSKALTAALARKRSRGSITSVPASVVQSLTEIGSASTRKAYIKRRHAIGGASARFFDRNDTAVMEWDTPELTLGAAFDINHPGTLYMGYVSPQGPRALNVEAADQMDFVYKGTDNDGWRQLWWKWKQEDTNRYRQVFLLPVRTDFDMDQLFGSDKWPVRLTNVREATTELSNLVQIPAYVDLEDLRQATKQVFGSKAYGSSSGRGRAFGACCGKCKVRAMGGACGTCGKQPKCRRVEKLKLLGGASSIFNAVSLIKDLAPTHDEDEDDDPKAEAARNKERQKNFYELAAAGLVAGSQLYGSDTNRPTVASQPNPYLPTQRSRYSSGRMLQDFEDEDSPARQRALIQLRSFLEAARRAGDAPDERSAAEIMSGEHVDLDLLPELNDDEFALYGQAMEQAQPGGRVAPGNNPFRVQDLDQNTLQNVLDSTPDPPATLRQHGSNWLDDEFDLVEDPSDPVEDQPVGSRGSFDPMSEGDFTESVRRNLLPDLPTRTDAAQAVRSIPQRMSSAWSRANQNLRDAFNRLRASRGSNAVQDPPSRDTLSMNEDFSGRNTPRYLDDIDMRPSAQPATGADEIPTTTRIQTPRPVARAPSLDEALANALREERMRQGGRDLGRAPAARSTAMRTSPRVPDGRGPGARPAVPEEPQLEPIRGAQPTMSEMQIHYRATRSRLLQELENERAARAEAEATRGTIANDPGSYAIKQPGEVPSAVPRTVPRQTLSRVLPRTTDAAEQSRLTQLARSNLVRSRARRGIRDPEGEEMKDYKPPFGDSDEELANDDPTSINYRPNVGNQLRNAGEEFAAEEEAAAPEEAAEAAAGPLGWADVAAQAALIGGTVLAQKVIAPVLGKFQRDIFGHHAVGWGKMAPALRAKISAENDLLPQVAQQDTGDGPIITIKGMNDRIVFQGTQAELDAARQWQRYHATKFQDRLNLDSARAANRKLTQKFQDMLNAESAATAARQAAARQAAAQAAARAAAQRASNLTTQQLLMQEYAQRHNVSLAAAQQAMANLGHSAGRYASRDDGDFLSDDDDDDDPTWDFSDDDEEDAPKRKKAKKAGGKKGGKKKPAKKKATKKKAGGKKAVGGAAGKARKKKTRGKKRTTKGKKKTGKKKKTTRKARKRGGGSYINERGCRVVEFCNMKKKKRSAKR